jgi:hypothetical protein
VYFRIKDPVTCCLVAMLSLSLGYSKRVIYELLNVALYYIMRKP